MRTSETITTIAPALVAAIAKIEGAAKSAKNDHFKSRYATLEAVIEASKDVLAEHKLCLLQFPGALTNGALGLETVLMHESGEWVSGDFQIALGKVDPQGVGSALTYARRYAQMAALNIPAVDDDAEGAMQRQPAKANLGPSPLGEDFPGASGKGKSSHQAKKDGTDQRFNELKDEIAHLDSNVAVGVWLKERTAEIQTMPESWRKVLREELDEQKRLILAQDEKEAA